MAHIPSVKSFGLIPYIMHQALKARDDVQHAEEAQREAEAGSTISSTASVRSRREDNLCRDPRQASRRCAHDPRPVPRRSSHEGVARTHLGYEVLVKLKVDEFLEQEYRPTDMHPDVGPAEIAAT